MFTPALINASEFRDKASLGESHISHITLSKARLEGSFLASNSRLLTASAPPSEGLTLIKRK